MLILAGISAAFSAVFVGADPAKVALSVYEVTGASPSLLLSPVLMKPVVGGSYSGKFTPDGGKSYVVVMAVYTSGAFSALDTDYDPQVAAVNAEYLSHPVQSAVGVVNCED